MSLDSSANTFSKIIFAPIKKVERVLDKLFPGRINLRTQIVGTCIAGGYAILASFFDWKIFSSPTWVEIFFSYVITILFLVSLYWKRWHDCVNTRKEYNAKGIYYPNITIYCEIPGDKDQNQFGPPPARGINWGTMFRFVR